MRLTDTAAAQLEEAAGRLAGKAGAVPSSPSGPLAAAATTSGGTSGNTSGAAGTSAPARSARVAKRALSEEDLHSESDEDGEEDEDASDDGATARRGRPRRSTRFGGGAQATKVRLVALLHFVLLAAVSPAFRCLASTALLQLAGVM